MAVSHWTRENSKFPFPIGFASIKGRKYATSPASWVNCFQADCVRDGSSWIEHSSHLPLMWRCGRLVWASAGVWIKAMAIATAAGIILLRFIGMSSSIGLFGEDPGRTAGIAMDYEPKVGVSEVKVVRTDRTGPLPGVPDDN